MTVKLQTLAEKIDDDFNELKGKPFERDRVYYSVSIDKRKTSTTVRKDNRIAYLIDTTHKANNTYSRFYIEDWRIGVMIAKLDDSSFAFIKAWLANIYESNLTEKHTVKFSRPRMPLGIAAMSIEMPVDMFYIKDVTKLSPSIDTTFGFTVSSRAFADFLCLTLSMEKDPKLKIAVTKHCILAELLRDKGDAIRSKSPEFKDIKTILDIENLYTKLRRPVDIERHDKKTFSGKLAKQYFESFTA